MPTPLVSDGPAPPNPPLQHQCARCSKMTSGPHTDKNPGHKTHYIDEQGRAYTPEEQAELGVPDNVSHGYCPDCITAFKREHRSGLDYRKKMQEWQEQNELDKTTERGRLTYQDTLDRVEKSFNETVHQRDEPEPEAETDSPE